MYRLNGMSKSKLEDELSQQLKLLKVKKPEREYRFSNARRFRFDFAWPEEKVACEVQGGVWVGGRHNRGKGYENDCDKLNLSQLEGWLLLYVTTTHIARGDAAELIRKALKVRKLQPPYYNDSDVV